MVTPIRMFRADTLSLLLRQRRSQSPDRIPETVAWQATYPSANVT